MRQDQYLRLAGIVAVVIIYVARLAFVGNGQISALGYSISPFAVVAGALVVLALPETIEKLPFGPNRSD